MAKLVLLSAGMTGRTHELKVDKTTIGRVEDNTFQIAEPSVSSHHCEVLLRGSDVVVRDLLLHTSGLNHRTSDIYRREQVRARTITMDQFIGNLVRVPLMEDPGTRYRYSAWVRSVASARKAPSPS